MPKQLITIAADYTPKNNLHKILIEKFKAENCILCDSVDHAWKEIERVLKLVMDEYKGKCIIRPYTPQNDHYKKTWKINLENVITLEIFEVRFDKTAGEENFFELSRESRDFIADYNDQVNNLAECVMILSGSYGEQSKLQCRTRIRNIDLWIAAKIEKYPLLTDKLLPFREHVRKKIHEVGLTPYPQFVYDESNQYKQ